MKYSGIGGQAVMEGVMMKNEDKYAVAVRKPNHEIEIKISDYTAGKRFPKIRKVPIIRGVFSFVDSLYLGMSTLMYSASFFEEEEVRPSQKEGITKEEKEKLKKKEDKQDKIMMGGTLVFSVVLALGIFFALPYFLSNFFEKIISSQILIAAIEGILRLAIFILYILLISLTPDIKRTFMYHGAEHKCINCIENGLELNVSNVKMSSKQHKRCGTSFLLIVMLISIVFFMFIQVDSKVLRLVLRLVLIPVIAGASYEFIRLAGRYDNGVLNWLSKPGLLMQKLTTKEPDEDMIEVAIASDEADYDWKKWQKEEGI